MSKIYLYKDGNEYTDITGGFSLVKVAGTSEPILTKLSDRLRINCPEWSAGTLKTTNSLAIYRGITKAIGIKYLRTNNGGYNNFSTFGFSIITNNTVVRESPAVISSSECQVSTDIDKNILSINNTFPGYIEIQEIWLEPSIDISVNPSGSGVVDVAESSGVFTITASPNPAYRFLNWLLKGYTQLEYIESSGAQYIDSGVIPSSTKKFVFDLKFNDTNSGRNGYINNIDGIIYRYYFGVYSDKYVCGIGTNYNHNIQNADTNRHLFELGDGYLKIDNVNVYTNTPNYSNALSFGIFNNTNNYYSFPCHQALYSGKIYDNGTLVRDFIPVIRHSDGAIGLLDLVNLKFYGNSGSGSFIGSGGIGEENIILEDNPLLLTLSNDISLQANFELEGYQVSTSVNPSGYGTTTGDGTYAEGASVTLTAIPGFAKKFDGWYENSTLVSTNLTYSFTMGNTARSFVAQFSNKEWIQPIIDRTIQDLRNKTSKAYFNATDWNRVEGDSEILATSMQLSLTTKNWEYGSIPTRSDFIRVRNNVLSIIRWCYPNYEISNFSTNYTYFNELENALQMAYDRIHSATISQPQCGYYNANEPNVLVAERN